MTQDVTGIFGSDGRQLVSTAVPIKATVKETAAVMSHPVESGRSVVDHVIINPVGIDLSMILRPADYKNVYAQFKQLFLNKTLLIVQTRTARYQRMIIAAMPHEESADFYDTIAMALSMQEVMVIKTQYGKLTLSAQQVDSPADTSTVNSGQVRPKSALAELVGL